MIESDIVEGYSANDLLFLEEIVQHTVAGHPGFACTTNADSWVMVPTCECEMCRPFRENYKPSPCGTPIEAARKYVEAVLAFYGVKSKTKLH